MGMRTPMTSFLAMVYNSTYSCQDETSQGSVWLVGSHSGNNKRASGISGWIKNASVVKNALEPSCFMSKSCIFAPIRRQHCIIILAEQNLEQDLFAREL